MGAAGEVCTKVGSRLALIAGMAVLGQAEAAADGLAERFATATPIKYLVVLFPENSSFDRYFGVYPRALNLAISPFARENFVSSALIDQSSILRFIEDNWLGGQRISATSFDNIAGSILDLFDFTQRTVARRLFLDPYSGLPLPARPYRSR